MSKKLIFKIISVICVIFFTLSIITVSNAETVSSDDVKSTFAGTSGTLEGSDTVTQIIASVLDIVRSVGAAVAVVILLVIAGKYILASAGDRADIKKYAVNYVIGAVILIAASGILSIVKEFVTTSLGS